MFQHVLKFIKSFAGLREPKPASVDPSAHGRAVSAVVKSRVARSYHIGPGRWSLWSEHARMERHPAKYHPHQGEREKARRRRQLAAQAIANEEYREEILAGGQFGMGA